MKSNIKPFFILSNPRSGSSLLRIICDSHSDLAVSPECGFIEWWYDKYKNLNLAEKKDSYFEIYCRDLMSSRKFETWKFDINLFKKLVIEENPKNYADVSALVHITYGIQRKEKIKAWGDKNNYYINHTSLLNHLFPTAKFIFIVRDGRDVATSYMNLKKIKSENPYFPNLATEIKEIANEWTENNLKVSSFLESINKTRSITLKYENLIFDLEGQCQKICRFLEVPFDPSMLNYFKNNRVKKLEPAETLEWKKKTLKSPDKLAIGKYKSELTIQEIEIFNSVAQEALKMFDYGV